MRHKAVLAALVIGGLAPHFHAAAADFSDAIDRWEHLRSDTSSTKVINWRLETRELSVTLLSGDVTVVRAGDEVAGLFLSGPGQVEYRSVDPVEFPLVLHNAHAATGLTAESKEKTVVLRGTFTEALVLMAGRQTPEVGQAGALASGPAFQRHIERWRHVRRSPLSHLFAIEKLDAPTAPVVVAEFSGGKTDLLYVLDEAALRSESLSALRKSSSNDPEVEDNLYLTTLSRQAVEHDRRDPEPPAFFLTDVRVDLQASDGNDATLAVVETVVVQKQRRNVLRFGLHNTVYAWVGSGVRSPRSYHVRSIADEAGRSLKFHHENGDLVVALAEPAGPDRPIRLRFQIDGNFLIRPGGDSFWILGVEPWFPQPAFGGQYYTWHAKIAVKKPFVPFSSGSTISRRVDGDFNVVETEIDKPVQFAVALAGKYDFDEETKSGVKILVASYVFHNAHAVKQLASLAGSIIEYYEAFLGPFPFSEFQILEINDLGFGQAPPGVMFITKEAFNPIQEENQHFSQGVNERFAHEIAHQYWGHVVKMPNPEEQWITESFAEYCAALFLKQFKGKGSYEGLLAHWKWGANYARDAAPIPLANEIYDPATGGELRFALLYDKGPYLLAALHKELGDDAFLTFLKSYQKSFQWKFGSTKTVARLLQFLTKKDYGPFFEANYWGTAMPH